MCKSSAWNSVLADLEAAPTGSAVSAFGTPRLGPPLTLLLLVAMSDYAPFESQTLGLLNKKSRGTKHPQRDCAYAGKLGASAAPARARVRKLGMRARTALGSAPLAFRNGSGRPGRLSGVPHQLGTRAKQHSLFVVLAPISPPLPDDALYSSHRQPLAQFLLLVGTIRLRSPGIGNA